MLVVQHYQMSSSGPESYIRSLASIVPFYNPILPPVAPHLRKLLSICKRSWIRDFLFNADPTHLQVLSSPYSKQHAITYEIAVSRYQPPIVAAPYGLAFDSSVVFIPAFSVDDISVGFGVDEKSYTSTQSYNESESPRHVTNEVKRHIEQFRYVRDDRQGVLIMLYNHDEYVEIEFSTHHNTRTRQRSTCRFNRGALMALLYANSEFMDDQSMLRATICIQFVDEFRMCPSCGAAPTISCGCSLSLVPPKHSLDFSNHVAQMMSHTGKYQGMVHICKFASGEQKCEVTLGSTINIKFSSAPNLVNRLTDHVLSRDAPKWPYSSQPSVVPAPVPRHQSEAVTSTSTLFQPVMNAPQPEIGGIFPTAPMEDVEISRVMRVSLPMQTSLEVKQETPVTRMTNEELEAQRQRDIKIERKRERNRASAHRSNMKKKRENDERKASLNILRQLETDLRAKERRLREENLRLRNTIYGGANPVRHPSPDAG
eukprot:GFKZ01000569.1.p1 GENE.GFKZ01000569.1~~GFKZ01000569.1.p1  ORF type:complete len:484 (-),score=48.52 GFKZ01000569.1:898-2349(-)